MSDSFITLVPADVKPHEVNMLALQLVDWLAARKIISSRLTDCVPPPARGYAPGLRYKEVVTITTFEFENLKINGLEVITSRQVFHNGDNGVEELNCPHCGSNNVESEWGEVIVAWDSNMSDTLQCLHCDKHASITEYSFKPLWGFGEFALSFWNWPTLSEKFVSDLHSLLKRDIKVIYGKL